MNNVSSNNVASLTYSSVASCRKTKRTYILQKKKKQREKRKMFISIIFPIYVVKRNFFAFESDQSLV